MATKKTKERGRPKKAEAEKCTARVEFYFQPTQKTELEKKAKQHGYKTLKKWFIALADAA